MFAMARTHQHTQELKNKKYKNSSTQEQTQILMCMLPLTNTYFRELGYFCLFAENESCVPEFFSLIRLAGLGLSSVAGAGFPKQ